MPRRGFEGIAHIRCGLGNSTLETTFPSTSPSMEEAEKLGTLEEILREAGYQRGLDGTWKSPRIVATEVMSLSA